MKVIHYTIKDNVGYLYVVINGFFTKTKTIERPDRRSKALIESTFRLVGEDYARNFNEIYTNASYEQDLRYTGE